MMHLWIITSKISSEHTLKKFVNFFQFWPFQKSLQKGYLSLFPLWIEKIRARGVKKWDLESDQFWKRERREVEKCQENKILAEKKSFANSKLGGGKKNAQTKMSCLKIEKKYSSFSNWWKWPFLVEFISSFEPKNNSIKLVLFCLNLAPNWTKIVSRKAQ